MVDGAVWGLCLAVAIAVPIVDYLHQFDRLHMFAALVGCLAAGCFAASLIWDKREDRYRRVIERTETRRS